MDLSLAMYLSSETLFTANLLQMEPEASSLSDGNGARNVCTYNSEIKVDRRCQIVIEANGIRIRIIAERIAQKLCGFAR